MYIIKLINNSNEEYYVREVLEDYTWLVALQERDAKRFKDQSFAQRIATRIFTPENAMKAEVIQVDKRNAEDNRTTRKDV